jgi:GT2 family glycosyltransferase
MPPPRPLDIIVPIYKNADLVRACVGSLLEHLPEVETYRPRLLLINDSPGDAEVETLLRGYDRAGAAVSVLHNEQNLGFVRTVNLGLQRAHLEGRDVLLVNSDTQTFPGTLAQLLLAAHADPQIGFACPRSNNASICSLPHFFGGTLPTPQEAHRRWAAISRTMPAYQFSPTAVGFYLFISYNVLSNHGGLREDFGLGYEEENDLVMRAGKVGMRAVIANHAFAYHAGSASFSLTELDLGAHKHSNLQKLTAFHPEFLPLVRRYEASPAFRAERLMGGLLGDDEGRLKVLFDLTGMGQHHNGTNEQAVAVLKSMAARQGHRIRLSGMASAESFRFHGLDQIQDLHRVEPGAPGLHGVAVRMAQPFDLHHVNVLESAAPVNVFAMLDTIAEDCGPLATDGGFIELWDHVAQHANGLFFISNFSEQTFCNRHPAALGLPRWRSLLPTKLASYAKPRAASAASHILVLGNHFPHKGSDAAARALAAALPTIQIVVLGAETAQSGNLTSYRSGLLEPELVDRLFNDASVVVLPSHEEGFGFGFMHALSAGRPVVARRIPATEEILATLDDVKGVFLFDHDSDLVTACKRALQAGSSHARDDRGNSWDDWADGLADFCCSLAAREDLYSRLVGRVSAGDLLRRARRGDSRPEQGGTSAPAPSADPSAPLSDAKPADLSTLLTMEGRRFVEHAYATLLLRPADEGGLRTYLAELEAGAHKVDILEALAHSPEGRLREVKLPGLDEALAERRRTRKPLLRRMFGR